MDNEKISYLLNLYFEKWQFMDLEGTLELLDKDCKLFFALFNYFNHLFF